MAEIIRTSDGFTIILTPQFNSGGIAIDTGRGPLRLTYEEAVKLESLLKVMLDEIEVHKRKGPRH